MVTRTRNSTVTIGATSVQVADHKWGKRTSITITNTSAAAVVTIAKGEAAAVAGEGLVKQPTGVFSESTDAGFKCWQGPIQVVGSVAGTVAVVETFEE